MKVQLLACGWTLLAVAGASFAVAFVSLITSDPNEDFASARGGWMVALAVVAVVCGLIGGIIVATLAALG